MDTTGYDVLPFPREREVVVDAGYLGTGRHIAYALGEADVTKARQLLKAASAKAGRDLSFTAFIVACLGQAVASEPKVQAYRDWRGRLVVFRDVDVVTMIEPARGAVAIPHVIRSANRKTPVEISDEVRSIQKKPELSEQRGGLVALAPKLPRFVRLLFFWLVKKNPHWVKTVEGTVVVSSVGMFGRGGGWGIGFLPVHTLGLLIGGIAQRPALVDGQLVLHDYLCVTTSFDHDVVDGAPAARFVQRFKELVESAYGLDTP